MASRTQSGRLWGGSVALLTQMSLSVEKVNIVGFKELAQDLVARGVPADIFIIGGATDGSGTF